MILQLRFFLFVSKKGRGFGFALFAFMDAVKKGVQKLYTLHF